MNITIGVGDDFTASITPFKRFSNSPFTPAPACKSPRSSDIRRTWRRASGTSPEARRNAKPSATAVLPTPGSPVRMGLFCRRRVRISITWRISPSRPRMGSILPACACAVRSVQNCSSGPPLRGVSEALPPPAEELAAEAIPASADSSLPSVNASKPPRRKASPEISMRLGTLSLMCRIRASSVSRAAKRWPERTHAPRPSREANIQASRTKVTISGERAGARALPVRNLSSARVNSACTRPTSIPCFVMRMAASELCVSTNLSKKCSISTL